MLVRWRTGAETRLLGFNVYREAHGQRVKVNHALIRSVFGGTTVGHRYSLLDSTAPRAGSLRYWMQSVALDGTRAWLGSTMAS